MNDFLGKFSLSLILRQFFCGVVFCVPCILAFSHGCTVFDKISGLTSESLILLAVISLIIGTVIYHIEKNTYSYFIQGVLLLTKKKKWFCGIALSVFVVALFLFCCFVVDLSFVVSLILFVGIAVIVSVVSFSGIASFYQRVWSIEPHEKSCDNSKSPVAAQKECKDNEVQKSGKNDKIKSFLVIGHLDTWSDNIHCVQCCCFAWLAGIVFTNWIVSHNCGHCSCQCCTAGEIIHESITTALKSPDCLFVYFLLILEIFFESHRFYHLYKITEEK